MTFVSSVQQDFFKLSAIAKGEKLTTLGYRLQLHDFSVAKHLTFFMQMWDI